MLSKNKIKLIQSLERKKNRDKEGIFLIEGNKMVTEALKSNLTIRTLICTSEFVKSQSFSPAIELIITDKAQIKKASLQKSPQDAIIIAEKPSYQLTTVKLLDELVIALDGIQDPGNMGTILRIADWYGIDKIVCSENCVDVCNPKVVQASMGAILRIKTFYTNLADFLNNENGNPIYGTFMQGKNIYTENLSVNGILVMGNEGNGISPEIENLITEKISIPSFAKNDKGSESLNVAIATAICCSEFKRRAL